MRIPHPDSSLLQLSPDGAMVDVEALADPGERLAVVIQLLCFIDLTGRETSLADRDVGALEHSSDCRRMDAEFRGELEGSSAAQILLT
jgi:hypothetical protein